MGRTWIHTDAERDALDDAQAARIADATLDAEGDTRPLRDGPATAGGDAKKLRGIPAIGPNVSGCIPGTDPEREATR